MCGIAGFWNFRSGRPAARATLERMTAALAHRGPDEDGYWTEGAVGLGMRRLQVVDPAGGHQPMPNEDGSIQVVFNGEIYNHRELRGELEAAGHRFRTRSDTEAIAHAYEQWGTGCVQRFNGMFAIAVWDARRQRLLLARDRLGIKPLYFRDGPEGVLFASELKAILATGWVPLDWDMDAVDDFMTYEFVPAPRSIVASVQKLPAASSLLVDGAKPNSPARPHRFWILEHQELAHPATADEAAAELRARLRTSVRRRLMADVPLGAFLSGGIDSTIIVGLMAGETAGEVLTFSLGFEDRSYNELRHARTAARHFGTRHRDQLVTPDIVGIADRLATFYDEPFADVSAFPTWLISSHARQHVTVALSGDGGDELFAGYDHYRAHRWAHRLRHVARTRGWGVADRMIEGLPPTAAKKGTVNKGKRFVEGLRRPQDLEHARWLVFWDLAERRALYSPAALDAVGHRDPFQYYRALLHEAEEQGFSGLQRQLYADLRGYLADDILAKVDRASMATSLEVRVPFLDHDVVEYAMAIPGDWKLRGSRSKWILRHAFADMIPAAILRRGKEGFSIPMKNWLRGPLQPLLHDLLAPDRVRQRGWFETEHVQRLVEEHLRGSHNHAHRLWCLMALELSLTTLTRAAPATVLPP
jgi:asparagine synthase (glutamine-hydrolysing)